MNQQPATVVVVNDDPIQLNILSALLRKGGCEALAFTRAEEALGAMEHGQPPDLIVTDLYMPGIDGWRFCRLLRSEEYSVYNQVPIVVVSATFAGDETSLITADLGANAFLPSPVDGPGFLELVASLLSGDRPQEKLRALIVEDSQTLASTLKKAFTARGYLADIALSRHEVLERFPCLADSSSGPSASKPHSSDSGSRERNSPYDLVVLDYHLPDGKGDALLAGIQEAHPDCVCIMMTSDPDPALALAWMKQGAAAYLRKPFKTEYLLELCTRARRERSLLRVEDLLEERTRDLREQEHRFRSILENLNEVVYATDQSGTVTYVSPNVLAVGGYRPEEVIGRSFLDFVHPEDVKDRMPQFLQALAGETTGSEYRFLSKNGEIFWVRTQARPRLENGEVKGVQGVLVDISDRKRLEEELRQSEERLRTLINAIPDIVCFKDGHGRWLEANDADLQLFQLQDVDYRGKKDSELAAYSPYFRELFLTCEATDEAAWQAGEISRGDEVISRPEGPAKVFDVIKVPTFFYDGSRKGLVVVGRDVSKRVQAEQTLAFHAQILSAVQDTVLVISPEMKTLWSNQIAREVFGDRPEMFTEPCYRFYKGRDSVCENCPVLKTMADGRTHQAVLQSLDKNGNLIWRMNRAYPLYDEQSRITAAIEVVSDYTEQKRLEEERLHLEHRLQQIEKAESLSRMAGAVAHHFNNMLAATIGNLELVRDNPSFDADVAANLAEAEQSARRAADMSRLMLTYLGQSQGRPCPLELAGTCRETLARLKAEIPDGVSLHINLPKPGPVIEADPEQFSQVLACLVTNAWEALANDSGRVTVAVGTAHEGRIKGQQVFPMDWEDQDRSQACLLVTDTGPGLETATIERIFDPFFTDKFTGRGLGLPVALGIVKAQGGCITVESEPGQGSTFRVYWPLSEAQGAPSGDEHTAEVQACTPAGITVLLVDDQGMVRRMAATMLERLGYEVLSARDGVEAVAIFRENRKAVQLVLTDLSMPRMNGWETLAAVRRVRPDIPVILCSGYDEARAMTGEQSEQPQAFLNKPYQIKDLQAALDKALDVGH